MSDRKVTENLGKVTAYRYATSATPPYEGTEEEFMAMLANVNETEAWKNQALAAAGMAEHYAGEAFSGTPDGYRDLVANVAENAEQTAVLSARVDQFAKLPDGSITTAADAELADIRAGADGLLYNTAGDAVRTQLDNLNEMKVGGAYVEDGYLYLTDGGNNVVAGPLGPFSGGGGGGGGGGNNAVMTAKNLSGWTSKVIGSGAECEFEFEWSSLEDDLPTGDGTLNIFVNNVIKHTATVAQGTITINLAPYFGSGRNATIIQVEDTYGNTRTLKVTVNVVAISLESSFDYAQVYTGAINFTYTPVGAVSKTMYFYLDGNLLGTQEVAVSGRQMTYVIPAQAHGAHTLRAYFTATIEEELVQSNELKYEITCVQSGQTAIIITSNFFQTSVNQYASIQIPYIVYNPASATTDISLYANGTLLSNQVVDRSEHSYTYKAQTPGTLNFDIVAGTVTKRLTMTVEEAQIDVEAETQDLVLYLTSQGRSNAEEHPDRWTYEDVSASFTGFNWTSDGWVHDSDGNTVLRVSGDDRVTVPFQIFARDFRGTGKTIEIEFATRNVLNYDAVVLSCMSGGRGLSVSAQSVRLASEQSEIGTQYKENEHVRITFVAEKRSENRLLYVYINGIVSGVIQYPDDDDFSQTTPVGITIGSSDCTIDVYNIRVYDNDLTRHQVLNNWIADTQSGEEMMERYERNNVYDAYGQIVISQLPSYLPYFIQSAPQLPQYKGDKKTVSGSYTDPQRPSKSFTFSGATSDVQGTSSQYYPRKNYKIKFGNGFVINGETVSKYGFNAQSIPVKTFTMKADVASSEGANNVELVKLYNDACPYKTPAQELNPKVRQGIDGYPMVMFWDDGTNVTFLGKYNFNNDKGTEEVFGFVDGDESWEIKNNTSDRVVWKSDDYTGSDWLNDFEARYPDEDPAYEDPTQLAEFAAWVKSTDTEQATGDALDNPVTYGGVEYTTDTAAYRLAKFKAEASNYMEMDSALFYYLFTELFLMVDSRAKNAFPSFMGEEVIGS